MAGEVQLKLGISLDLGYFRTEMQKAVNIVNSEFTGRLKVKFDRQILDKELNNLQRAVKRRVYRIEIGGNIDTLPDKIKNLQQRLKELERLETGIGVTAHAAVTKKDAKKVRSEVYRQVVSEGGKILIPTGLTPISGTAAEKLKADIAKKIGTISVQNEVTIGVTAQAAVTKQEARKARVEIYRQIISEDGKILLPIGLASISQIAADRFKTDLLKKIGTITVNVKTNLEARAEGGEVSSPKTFRQELGELNLEQLKNIYAAAARDALLSFEQGIASNKGKIITALNQAAQDAGQGFVNALQDQESNLSIAAGKYANSLLGGLKKTLKIQSPSLEMWEIGSDAGKGFEEGLLKALEIAENSAVRQTRRMLDRLARMVMMAAGISGPTIDRQLLEVKAPSPINFPATIPPRQSISSGPSSTGRALPAGRDPAGLISGQTPIGLLPSISGRSQIQAIVESLIAQQGPRMLPSGGGPLADTKRTYAEINKRFDQLRQRMFTVLESDVKEVSMGIKDSLNSFAFLVQALKDAETRSKNNRIDEEVDAFFASIENALRLAATRAKVEAVKIQDLGAQPVTGALPPAMVPPSPQLLPAAGGTGGYFRGGRRPGGGFVPEGGFPSDGMAVGPQGPKNMLSLDYYKNAFKYAEALKIAEASAKNFRASQLPLIGGLQGIAAEFGEATKQVLLYGTAYKGLAFITSLPGQILNAAKSQQQYSNAMQVATQETGSFAKEMLFVDNVQRAFGLNLETTRQGFTRLYASMAPAGFDSGSIEKLFTGISAATAALQLTPDKAERVIYAFGQMASKGQAMSEELKGQLGDVLPGALSIFANAAGKSVKEFNKELEDGVYSGGKFRDLMAKVTDELINRFGSGAAAAGRSLQGLLNTVQGDFQRTLESFSPLANAAAQAILQPIAGSLRQLSTSAQIATGEIERIQGQIKQAQTVVSDLRIGGAKPEQIRAAEQNVLALQVRYEALNEALKDPAIAKQVQDIQRFTQELAKAGTFVMNVASAIGSALSPIINILGTNLTTVISLITSFYIGFQTARLAAMALMGVLLAYKSLSSILGFGPAALSANALAAAFNGLGVAATGAKVQVVGLRLALTALVASTVVGLVVAGIMTIAGAFATMRDRAKEASQSSRDAAKAAVEAANSGNVAMANMQVQTILSESRANKKALETLQKLRERATPLQREGGFKIALTPEEAAALRGSKLTENLLRETKGGARQAQLPTSRRMQQLMRDFGSVAGEEVQSLREAKAAQQEALRNEKRLGLNQPSPSTLPPETVEDKDAKKRAAAAEKAAEDARRLADEKRKYEADLIKVNAAQTMALDDAAFQNWKSLQDQRFDYLEVGQNEWMKREIKFQRDLQAIEIRRIEAIRQARRETQKAETEANARAIVAQEKLPFKGGAVTSRRRDPDAERTGWDISMPGGMGAPVPAPIDLTITGTGFQGRGAGASGRGYGNWISGEFELGGKKYELLLGHFGKVDVSKGMQVPAGTVLGTQGVTGRAFGAHVTTHVNPKGGATTQDAWNALETVTQRWEKGMAGAPASRARKEAVKDYQAQLAVVQAVNQKEIEAARIKLANEEAQRSLNVVIKDYVASIAPVDQQRLENSLLQERIKLISSGLFGEALNTQQKIAEVEMRRTLGVQTSTKAIGESQKLINDNNAAVKAGTKTQQQANYENEIYAQNIEANTLKIKELNQATKDYIPTLQEALRLTQQSAEAELQGAIQRATPLGGIGLSAGFIGDAAVKYEEAIGRNAPPERAAYFAELQNQLTLLETRNNAIRSSILGIGDAFGTAMTAGVASLVDGTSSAQEVFSNFLKTVGQTLLQAAQQMIATYIAIGIAKIFAGLGGGGGGGSTLNINDALKYSSPIAGFANGGVAQGGFVPFKAFANGGIVSGPTLGLVGEGKYNEAIVPLPDGRSIPVTMRGEQSSSRELLSNQGATNKASTPVLNMSFQTTTINGVEYVSKDQLEAAMMETRKLAARDGANRGAALAIDRLQHSPNTRRRIGI